MRTWAAVIAIAILGGTAACEKAKHPAEKKDPAMQGKAIVMPAKPLTDAEKAALFKAVKGFVEAVQAKEPTSYTDLDWRLVQFRRMGIYFHVQIEKTRFTPHTPGVSPSYVFRTDKEMKNVTELTAR